MKRSTLALAALGIIAFAPARAFAQASDDGGMSVGVDMTAPACMRDSDCAGTLATPYCCTGSSCPTANVCLTCTDYLGNPCAPLACDGALCDTTNGSACSVGDGVARRGSSGPIWFAGALVVAIGASLRRRRAREHGR